MCEVTRKINIVVSTMNVDSDGYDDSFSSGLETQVYSLEDFLQLDWVRDQLGEAGFYSKDEVSSPQGDGHLNKFLYEYNYDYNPKYKQYTSNLNEINSSFNICRVYQEVIGPERMQAFAKWKRSRQEFLRKQEEVSRNAANKKAAAAEKRRLKKIEQAKKILAEEKV